MRLDDELRETLFLQGEECAQGLGAPFQNPQDLTALDVNYAASFVRQSLIEVTAKYNAYLSALATLERTILKEQDNEAP